MFDIYSRQGKLQYQRELVRNMIILERINSREIQPILGRCYLDSANLIELGVIDIDHVIYAQYTRLKNIFVKHYKRVSTYASNKVFDFFDEEKSEIIPQIKTIKDEFWKVVLAWIDIETARRITKVNNTTKNLIKNVISKGINEGKSYKEIAKDLRTIKNITNPRRAMMIARTETHTVMVHGLDEAVKTTEIEMEREWSSVLDERTRGSNAKDQFNHIIANGERVKQDEPFIMTGEALDYPGDPNGSPGNIINCRCVILYYVLKKIVKSKFYRERRLQWS